MRRGPQILALAVTQVAAALVLGQPASAHHTIVCNVSYQRNSPNERTSTYEQGYVIAWCGEQIPRIDVSLTYVYCPTQDPASCNTSGTSVGHFEQWKLSAYNNPDLAVYNLRGWYKAIVRASFTLPSGHSFDGRRDWAIVPNGNPCGSSSANYWSCAFDTGTFERGR